MTQHVNHRASDEIAQLRAQLAAVTAERDNRQAQLDMLNAGIEMTVVSEIETCKAYSKLENAELIRQLDEARASLAEVDKLMESQYIAGAKFGWNCGVTDDKNRFEAAVSNRSAQS